MEAVVVFKNVMLNGARWTVEHRNGTFVFSRANETEYMHISDESAKELVSMFNFYLSGRGKVEIEEGPLPQATAPTVDPSADKAVAKKTNAEKLAELREHIRYHDEATYGCEHCRREDEAASEW